MKTYHLDRYQRIIDSASDEVRRQDVIARIWAKDYTLWSAQPDEIVNRMGWLHCHQAMRQHIPQLATWVKQVRAQGLRHALLLGMGGSSLAPQLYAQMWGTRPGHLQLEVLDTTDPDAVHRCAGRLVPERTLVIVSSKSGGTIETLSLFRYFHQNLAQAVGPAEVGRHFVAITDPGSALESLAHDLGFRDVFLNDPEIGGRYAALSLVGLLPAALLGTDLEEVLKFAAEGTAAHSLENSVRLGVILGELAKAGRDKLTFLLSPHAAALGGWLEQLVAESTGKKGAGILPIVAEPLGPPSVYGDDRVFVHIAFQGEADEPSALHALRKAGHPWIEWELRLPAEVAGHLYQWMWVTAVACQRLGVNPFDQPDVESAKRLTRQWMSQSQHAGASCEPAADLVWEAGRVYGVRAASVQDALKEVLRQAPAGGYVALHAYVEPSAQTDQALATLRESIRKQTQLATSAGYAPRLLHSTGQLFKGDAGRGVFIQISHEPRAQVLIPPEGDEAPLALGTLLKAQAWGDFEALRQAGRRVVRFHLCGDITHALRSLAQG